MRRRDLETALALIAEHADDCDFVGPRDSELVQAAENALGLKLPTLYRLFVEELGAGAAGSQEFYGVISQPFTGPILDAVWATLEERVRGLPTDVVIVGDTGMGGWYVIRAGGAVEPAVEILHATEAYDQPTEMAAEDFGAFLLDGVTTGLGLT